MNKLIIFLLMIIAACSNKSNESKKSEDKSPPKTEFDFSFDQVKMFHVDSFNIRNKCFTVHSSCSAFQINFPTDISILNRLICRNQEQIRHVKADSIKLEVNYINHGGKGLVCFDKSTLLELCSEFDENKANYYNKVADLMYSDTLLYINSSDFAVSLCFILYGNENIWDNSWNFNCFEFFMKVNNELMKDIPFKYNYEVWKQMEADLIKYQPNNPILKRVKEISQIFSLNLRKGQAM